MRQYVGTGRGERERAKAARARVGRGRGWGVGEGGADLHQELKRHRGSHIVKAVGGVELVVLGVADHGRGKVVKAANIGDLWETWEP